VHLLGESLAPQVWYSDDTIVVLDASAFRCVEGRVWARDRALMVEQPLEWDRVFWIRRLDQHLERIDLRHLRQRLCR
jgi:hypothetical protein